MTTPREKSTSTTALVLVAIVAFVVALLIAIYASFNAKTVTLEVEPYKTVTEVGAYLAAIVALLFSVAAYIHQRADSREEEERWRNLISEASAANTLSAESTLVNTKAQLETLDRRELDDFARRLGTFVNRNRSSAVEASGPDPVRSRQSPVKEVDASEKAEHEVFRTFIGGLYSGPNYEPGAGGRQPPRSAHPTTDREYVNTKTPAGAIYWLDELLQGGFHRPKELNRPLIVVFSGPPGVGKSLLLQQLCYLRALAHRDGYLTQLGTSAIVQFETAAGAVIKNAQVLQWDPGVLSALAVTAEQQLHLNPRKLNLIDVEMPAPFSGRVGRHGDIESLEKLLRRTLEATPVDILGLDGLNTMFRPEDTGGLIDMVCS